MTTKPGLIEPESRDELPRPKPLSEEQTYAIIWMNDREVFLYEDENGEFYTS